MRKMHSVWLLTAPPDMVGPVVCGNEVAEVLSGNARLQAWRFTRTGARNPFDFCRGIRRTFGEVVLEESGLSDCLHVKF